MQKKSIKKTGQSTTDMQPVFCFHTSSNKNQIIDSFSRPVQIDQTMRSFAWIAGLRNLKMGVVKK